MQAQKFGSLAEDDDDEMDEESLLETPLDKLEPYGMFKHVLMSMINPFPLGVIYPLRSANQCFVQTSNKNSRNSTRN